MNNIVKKLCLVTILVLVISNNSFSKDLASQESIYDYNVVVDFSSATLLLYGDDWGYIKEYPVALPRAKVNLPIFGEVTKIVKDPWWFPTEPTRKAYKKKNNIDLPTAIAPGNSLNAMGQAKIYIKFLSKGVNPVIRIHGTNDDKSIGQRISRGCIRMRNSDVLDLISIISDKKTSISFR